MRCCLHLSALAAHSAQGSHDRPAPPSPARPTGPSATHVRACAPPEKKTHPAWDLQSLSEFGKEHQKRVSHFVLLKWFLSEQRFSSVLVRSEQTDIFWCWKKIKITHFWVLVLCAKREIRLCHAHNFDSGHAHCRRKVKRVFKSFTASAKKLNRQVSLNFWFMASLATAQLWVRFGLKNRSPL